MLDMEKAEKVKQALSACAGDGICESDCPYFCDDNCQCDIAADALEIIEEMEKALKMFVPLEGDDGQ